MNLNIMERRLFAGSLQYSSVARGGAVPNGEMLPFAANHWGQMSASILQKYV